MLQPEPFSGRGQYGIGQRTIVSRNARHGIHPGHTLSDQCRRVGHAANNPLADKPAGQGCSGNAGRYADMQRTRNMGRSCCGCLPELLRLDRPDDHIGLPQAGIGRLQGAHAIALLQTEARFQPGIDHGDLLRRNSLLAQPTQNGAGHVTSANENYVLHKLLHTGSPRLFFVFKQSSYCAACVFCPDPSFLNGFFCRCQDRRQTLGAPIAAHSRKSWLLPMTDGAALSCRAFFIALPVRYKAHFLHATV